MVEQDLVPLRFSVVEKSSEEAGHDASKLCEFREDGEGWQSSKSDSDTETLVLKVKHQDEKRMIHALEILCHENKIAEKIEISLGCCDQGGSTILFDQCASICHLGYITLDSNQRSGYQARELKSIPIEKQADYVKLTLRGCHKNPLNPHNLVALVGIRLLGPVVSEQLLQEDAAALVSKSECSRPQVSESPMTAASRNVPVKKIEIPPAKRVSSLPPHVRQELDPKTQSSVDRLERLKKERASLEDFEMAGKIKDALSVVYALLTAYKECERKMREAAASEDYALASKLKLARDQQKSEAAQALLDVEQQFIGRIDEIVGDLSISTIKDESFISQKSKNFSPKKSILETSSIASHPEKSEASEDESCDDDSQVNQDGDHPLKGVENAEELPAPEDPNENGDGIAHNVEEYFGSYLMKCFFSKNWMLREAALTKMNLLIPEICSNSDEKCADVMVKIIEHAIDDKNVQVYVETLVLLGGFLTALESMEPPLIKITSLLSRVVVNLLSKLADAKQKVADGAELALLSMASSSCVDQTLVLNAATKRIRSKESKGGRVVKARLSFLSNFFAEFGDSVAWERAVEFSKAQNSFEHKDGGVRDAAKSLVVTLMVINGEKVLDSLQDKVSEKQLIEFRSRFARIVSP